MLSSFTVSHSGKSLAQSETTDYFGRKESVVTRFNAWDDAHKIVAQYSYEPNISTSATEQVSYVSTTVYPNNGRTGFYSWQYDYYDNGNIVW